MSTVDELRTAVRDSYARAVTSSSSCCGEQKGVAVRSAGYSPEELAALPDEAVVNAFGCGNPLAFAAVQAGETVLDLGSGAGIDLLLAARRVGPSGRVIGVDMTEEMIERARQNAAAAGLANVEVRQGLIEALPVSDSSVDWVISNCVINLSPEKERVFAEIARVLRPGGRVSIADIVAEDLPAWVTANAAAYSACLAGAIPEPDYVAGLQRAGLTAVAVTDRLVYDEGLLEGIVASELDSGGCCGGSVVTAMAKRAARELVGKVASVRFTATKPGHTAG